MWSQRIDKVLFKKIKNVLKASLFGDLQIKQTSNEPMNKLTSEQQMKKTEQTERGLSVHLLLVHCFYFYKLLILFIVWQKLYIVHYCRGNLKFYTGSLTQLTCEFVTVVSPSVHLNSFSKCIFKMNKLSHHKWTNY